MILRFTRATLLASICCLVLVAANLGWASTQEAPEQTAVGPDGSGPNAPNAGSGGPQVPVCKPVNGIVRDVRGRPLFQAKVWGYSVKSTPNCSGNSYVMTDPAGRYTVFLPAGQLGGTLYASKERFSTKSESVPYPNPDDPTMNLTVDFELRYLYTLSVTPPAFNTASRSLTFDSYTTAPVAELDATGIAQAEVVPLPDVRVPMQTVTMSGDPEGQTHWRATWTMPSDAEDGTYIFSSCLFDPILSSDGCSGGALLSDVATTTAKLDRAAPTFGNSSPGATHNTLSRHPTISVAISDALSGVDWSAISMTITQPDGSTTTIPAAAYTPPSPFPLGRYSVTLTASDLAGNVASASWQFGVISFSPESSSVSLESQSVDVNPDGKVVGAPTTVTFHDVAIGLSAFEGQISAAPFTGYGRLLTQAALSNARVVFTNETPVPSEPVSAGLTSVTFEKYGGVLLPTDRPNTIAFKESTIIIPQVTVNVPPGYNTAGSRAHILMDEHSPNAPFFEGQTLPVPVPLNLPVLASTSQTIEVMEETPESVALGTGTAPKIYVWSSLPGDVDVFWPFDPSPTDYIPPTGYSGSEITFSDPPTPVCANDSECVVAGTTPPPLSQSQDFLTSSKSSFTVGRGEIYFLGHHFLFLERDLGNSTNNYIDWHQTSGLIRPSHGCLQTYTSQSATTSSGWSRSAPFVTDPTTISGDSRPTFRGTFSWKTFQSVNSSISNSSGGFAHILSIFDDNSDNPDPASRVTSWSVPSSARPLGWDPQQMVSAFEYSNDQYPRNLKLEQQHSVSFVLGGACS